MSSEIYIELFGFISNLYESQPEKERVEKLDVLVKYIQEQKDGGETIKLNFICTHNSRRSHLCQVWAKTMASFYAIDDVRCYSGGTEATAAYPVIIRTLKNTGFDVTSLGEDQNPTYKLRFDKEMCPMTLFSKTYDNEHNPNSDFAAVMTCNDADQNCPIIPNSTRISLPYVDPKVSDGTDKQKEVYAERSKQIATEMKYVFSKIK
ncbi:protein-tyrosine-phosphatase [Bacteroidia bacterium]|nr:protein-tyrosine-phosphatase [Bacteroidia bacterium]MDC1395465.1 protein-tyrosine-phosphatase [Bacteroidia bacterium]